MNSGFNYSFTIPYTRWIIPLFVILTGCASVKKIAVENDVTRLLKQSEIFSNQFTGFSLYDIESNEFVAGYNSTLKFTPASNTKLLTWYVTAKTFSDSLPALVYDISDSIIHTGTLGDPTFLYQPFKSQPTFDILQRAKKVVIHWPKDELAPYGPGWAWDDYVYDFQSQLSWWPIYGNAVRIQKMQDSLSITPGFFEDYVEVLKQERPGELVAREKNFNVFRAYLESDTSSFERVIPFEYSQELLLQLLQDTLKLSVEISETGFNPTDTLYAQHIDTVLARMLKPSDNFLADHLLLMTAKWNGYEDVKSFIRQTKITWLSNLTDMVWVDGSGLSRYNLISPIDQIRLLKKCHDEMGWDRVTALLPTGGEGTLESLYLTGEDEAPYLFAKTGTLSNNHNLSGFLITRSGKRMIFSFMNNHYIQPTDKVKAEMESFLLDVRNAY